MHEGVYCLAPMRAFRCSWCVEESSNITATFQQLLSSFFISSFRDKADHSRLPEALLNTQHILFYTKGLAFSTPYKLTHKSILEFEEEIMQKEHVLLCNVFFSQGTTDSKQKAMVQSRARAFYLKRPSLKRKFCFHSRAGNVPWYFIHLFIQPLCPGLDSR